MHPFLDMPCRFLSKNTIHLLAWILTSNLARNKEQVNGAEKLSLVVVVNGTGSSLTAPYTREDSFMKMDL